MRKDEDLPFDWVVGGRGGLRSRVGGGAHGEGNGGGGLKTRLGIEGGAVCEADGAELGRLWGGEGCRKG